MVIQEWAKVKLDIVKYPEPKSYLPLAFLARIQAHSTARLSTRVTLIISNDLTWIVTGYR